jgi:hypothetical protein
MITITRTSSFENVDLNNAHILTGSDILFVECTEVDQNRLNKPEQQLQYGFGLTQLGGLTTQLGHENILKIAKFNYHVEEQNQVGLCVPYNLVIAPSSFFLKVCTNNFDSEVQKHIDDIIKANEEHQKRASIYIDFLYSNSSGFHCYWENENIKKISLNNLEKLLSAKIYRHTKYIYLVC